MKYEKISVIPFKTDEQTFEFINPGPCPFRAEPVFIYLFVEKSFAPSFRLLTLAPVFSYIRYDTVIKADFPDSFGVKCRIGVEIRTGNRQFSLLHAFENSTEIIFKLVGIIVIACDNFRRGDRIAVFIQQRQDVGCLSFFPPHYHRNNNLQELVSLCECGYGEIELHLHHGKTNPDTPENLENTLKQCVEEYSYFGIFGSEKNKKKYGFIHGESALDNSLNGISCGVNNEIQILKNTGCYADFTFPSLSMSNPIKVNSIYYAIDNPIKPKSYNVGINVRRSNKKRGDLMIIQGPLYPAFKKERILGLRMEGVNINGRPPKTKRDIDLWVNTNIHVTEKK